MGVVQSVVIFLAVVAMGAAPWMVSRALRRDERDAPPPADTGALPDVLSPVQAYARHLYGEAYGWSRFDMANYDHNAWMREPWEAVAKVRITDEALTEGAAQ